MNAILIADVRVSSNTTETSIGLEWTPVGCFLRNGLPLSVRIVVRSLRTQLVVEDAIVADTGSYTSTGLQSGTRHSFLLFADYKDIITRNNGTEVAGVTLEGQGEIALYLLPETNS